MRARPSSPFTGHHGADTVTASRSVSGIESTATQEYASDVDTVSVQPATSGNDDTGAAKAIPLRHRSTTGRVTSGSDALVDPEAILTKPRRFGSR